MNSKISLSDITIRNEIRPGDLGYIIHRHGKLYDEEYRYGIAFETYVGAGLHEFYTHYDPQSDRVWIAGHEGKIVGFLLLMHREHNTAQLRYFYLEPGYRGIGLGKRLMELYMDFLLSRGYSSSYLWTTHELHAAASLYTRHGFRLTEEKASTAFGKPLKEQRYDLVLPPAADAIRSPASSDKKQLNQ
jgi:GNAT superfamily N-acetyltransferase